MSISPKRGWLLSAVRNATLPVVALRVDNPDPKKESRGQPCYRKLPA